MLLDSMAMCRSSKVNFHKLEDDAISERSLNNTREENFGNIEGLVK